MLGLEKDPASFWNGPLSGDVRSFRESFHLKLFICHSLHFEKQVNKIKYSILYTYIYHGTLSFLSFVQWWLMYTLLKFNIAPEKLPFQKESSLPTIIFQGWAAKLRGCNWTTCYDLVVHVSTKKTGNANLIAVEDFAWRHGGMLWHGGWWATYLRQSLANVLMRYAGIRPCFDGKKSPTGPNNLNQPTNHFKKKWPI